MGSSKIPSSAVLQVSPDLTGMARVSVPVVTISPAAARVWQPLRCQGFCCCSGRARRDVNGVARCAAHGAVTLDFASPGDVMLLQVRGRVTTPARHFCWRNPYPVEFGTPRNATRPKRDATPPSRAGTRRNPHACTTNEKATGVPVA
jgi:hypothetical protein